MIRIVFVSAGRGKVLRRSVPRRAAKDCGAVVGRAADCHEPATVQVTQRDVTLMPGRHSREAGSRSSRLGEANRFRLSEVRPVRQSAGIGREGAECGMDLYPGARMWLPCEVKPGPFSDERMVLIMADGNEWFGFVNVRWLRRHGSEDTDEVLGESSRCRRPHLPRQNPRSCTADQALSRACRARCSR